MSSTRKHQQYKDEVIAFIRETNGEITDSQRLHLDALTTQLDLSSTEALEIEDKIIISLRKYENTLLDVLKHDYPKLNKASIETLKSLQQDLQLENEDVKVAIVRLHNRIAKGEIKESSSDSFKLIFGGLALGGLSTWLVPLLIAPAAPVLVPLLTGLGIANMAVGFATQGVSTINKQRAIMSIHKVMKERKERSQD